MQKVVALSKSSHHQTDIDERVKAAENGEADTYEAPVRPIVIVKRGKGARLCPFSRTARPVIGDKGPGRARARAASDVAHGCAMATCKC